MKRAAAIPAWTALLVSAALLSDAAAGRVTREPVSTSALAHLRETAEKCAETPAAWTRLSGLPLENWTSRPIDIAPHRELRSRYGLPMPDGRAMIAIYSFSVHHSGVYQSLVATRSEDGRWALSQVVEEGGGLIGGPKRLSLNRSSLLSDTAGKAIDRLLADPCLRSEPTLFYSATSYPGIGVPHHAMAIVTPQLQRSTAFFGAIGRTEAIRAALMAQ